MKLEKIAFELIKDLNNKFPRYNAKRISDFNKLVKHFKSKMPNVSNIKLGQIALDYHNYREKGDMGVKIPTIKKMAHTMKKIGMKESFGGILRNLAKHAAKKRMYDKMKKRKRDKGGRFENKMSDKEQYDYLVYMRKYKPDIWRDLQGNKKVKKIMKKFESVNEKKGDFLSSLFPKSKVDKAIKIAKKMSGNMTGAVKAIEKFFPGMSKHNDVQDALRKANEGLDDLKALPKDLKKSIKKNRNEVFFESNTEDGMTTNHIYYEIDGKGYGYTLEFVNELNEAEYQGRKVKLGKIMQGDQKKFKVYVKNPKGNVVKVNFGQGGKAKGGTMRIRKSNPKARKSFRARHNCDNPGPKWKARYWACRTW